MRKYTCGSMELTFSPLLLDTRTGQLYPGVDDTIAVVADTYTIQLVSKRWALEMH